MTFHGHGYLSLALPDVAPISSSIYSGFGFRSTQDSAPLYQLSSPVSGQRGPLGGSLDRRPGRLTGSRTHSRMGCARWPCGRAT